MGILGRARKMVGGFAATPPRTPQLYQVACVAGHRLRGERTEAYQALRCPSCGDGIFVLPRSPLPEPSAPRAPARSRTERPEPVWDDEDGTIALTDPIPQGFAPTTVPPDDADIEIEWEDPPEPAAAASVAPAPPPSGPAKDVIPKKSCAKRPGPSPRPAAPAPVVRVAGPTLIERAKSHPTALITLGVVVLVAGALVVRHDRLRRERLPKVVELGRTEGLAKLDAGEFQVAKRILAEAAAAVDDLGGRVEGAGEVRQGAREAAIFTDLVPESLERIVEEAATFRVLTDWTAHFNTMYRGRSIILDAPLIEVPDASRPG